ncbi:MAG: phenylalanine--tRNA ligase subunit beta [Planctomycetota bacterium]|nr:phenylalanine--tRNA ligase subunit beta [Planctomycetota bacterium]
MLISVAWLRRYLDAEVSAPDIERALIDAGFPVEHREPLPDGDVRLDVEVTSNRGDCLSHLGLAREAAARLGIGLRPPVGPALVEGPKPVSGVASLENLVPESCPWFTLRVVRGVRVGPSPAWLREALENAGQRSINNVVDVTNFIAGELGNPCHAFDLDALDGRALVVRRSTPGETLTTLDGKVRTLAGDEIVVADRARPQSLAGVMGGQASEVTERTRDVAFEMATWDPVAVRRSSRRHGLRTEASHRFERVVDARTIDEAARRAAGLLAEVAGGSVCAGVLEGGRPVPGPTRVVLRPSRCRALLGVELGVDEMVGALGRLEIGVEPVGRAGESLVCTIPPFRPDVTREADVIEEVARVVGFARLPVRERVEIAVRPAQPTERARRLLSEVLAGLGFYEVVTFSFTGEKAAGAFCPRGVTPARVDDERRGEEPVLRPSLMPGLLACRRTNQRAFVRVEGGVRLFELAPVFGERDGASIEHRATGLLLDVPVRGKSATVADLQAGLRLLRGAVDALAERLAGATVELTPGAPDRPGLDSRAFARVLLRGKDIGWMGLIAPEAQKMFDLDTPCAACELDTDALLAAYPPVATVRALPAFPGIERDISLIVPEATTWAAIEAATRRAAGGGGPFEGVAFVGTYRGSQIGAGRKSVTIRLSYRDATRTLRHEEIDGPAGTLQEALKAALGAEVRA